MYDNDYRGDGFDTRDADHGGGDGYEDGELPCSAPEDDGYGSRSPPRRHHRSQSPRYPPAGYPSDTIILEGLPLGLTTEQVYKSISRSTNLIDYPGVDIRVPPARGDNRRAFVQFAQIEHAISFMDKNHPKIHLELDSSSGASMQASDAVFIHFARSRNGQEPRFPANDAQWPCSNCDFSNYAMRDRCKNCGSPKTASLSARQNLTGETDAGTVQSQILVVYPLSSSVMEEDLAASLRKLELEAKPPPARSDAGGLPKLKSTAPTGDTTGLGAKQGSLHRVFLMRDRETDASLKYGFVEFWTVEDALAALNKFQKSRSFTILGQQPVISTIHLGVFVQDPELSGQQDDRFSFCPLFNPEIRVRYWEPSIYPSPFTVNAEAPVTKQPGDADGDKTSDSKKSKKRKADANLGPGALKKSVPMAGQMAMWQRKHVELYGGEDGQRPGESDAGQSSEQSPARTPMGSGSGAPSPAKTEQRPMVKISLASAARVAGTTSSASEPAVLPEKQPSSELQTKQPAVSYVDREKVCCLICMMKYKSLDDLGIHERSRNHKNATEDEEKVKAALPRLAARDKRLQKKAEETGAEEPDTQSAAATQYRDRAKERRQVFNQPSKPKVPVPAAGKPARKEEVVEKPKVAAPSQSKGSAMLAKMGWSAGQGLGAHGEGRTDIIATNAYQEGVGLGAEGSNLGDAAELAERRTKNSYAEYVNQVQDKARERYNRLG